MGVADGLAEGAGGDTDVGLGRAIEGVDGRPEPGVVWPGQEPLPADEMFVHG
jgi:hypothetical protein